MIFGEKVLRSTAILLYSLLLGSVLTGSIVSVNALSEPVQPIGGLISSDCRLEVVFDTETLTDLATYLPELKPEEPILIGRELYDSYVDEIHDQFYPELDTAIVRAVIETESHYIPDVGNPSGAIGLMQIVPKWHLWRAEKYGLTDLWDPYTNILVGMDLINELHQKYGDYRRALYDYNRSTAYVEYVLSIANDIRKEGG